MAGPGENFSLSAANADILRRIETPVKIRFIYFLYRLLLAAAAPLLVLYFLVRIRRDRRYARNFAERLGVLRLSLQPTPAGAIWLHAVSVGEVLSAIALVAALRKSYPEVPVFISCATVAGRAIAEEKLSPSVEGLFYAPLDYAFCVRRVLKEVRPSLVVVMETEIWPNLYREVKRYGAALAIVNGRISDRALPRYRSWRAVFGAVLSHPDLMLVQSPEDRRRYIEVGAPPDRVEAAGNLKYDFDPGESGIPIAIREFLDALKPGLVWVAASTMPPLDSGDCDEDNVVIAAFRKLAVAHPDLLLILAPRRPGRFPKAALKLDESGLGYVRRSVLPVAAVPDLPCVLLLDSMGELSRLFSLADVVFMGGTLARRGGHNILEPSYFGRPVIAGPHMENFAAIAREFTDSAALVRISEPSELQGAVERLLSNPAVRDDIGRRAQTLAGSKRGVTARIAQRLLSLYLETLPLPPGPRLLAPLSAVWERETARRRTQAVAQKHRLPRPVISIGGITMGGAGKTPFTAWLAAELRAQGAQPAILTRGYRRRSGEPFVILAAGSHAPADLTGDEPQIYLRQGAAHIGIGADRYRCGGTLAQLHETDVFLLDDGFQHWPLHRDLDLVLIDALDPFGGGRVFPSGRLREPLSALARASAFILTRAEPGFRTEPIERELRRWNPNAPVFRSRVRPLSWRDIGTNRTFDNPPFQSALAFCGLANPRSFWRTLEASGVDVRFRWEFGDHHRYRILELKRIGRRARAEQVEALVTTEKDVANLSANALASLAPLPVYALEIGLEIDDAGRLLRLLKDAIGRSVRHYL